MSPPEMTATLWRLLPDPIRRMARYGCVGLVVSIFYSLLVIALVNLHLGLTPTMAVVAAFAVTLPIGYLVHGAVSFHDRPYDPMQPLRFAISTTTNFTVMVGGMYWITEIAHQSYLFGIAWNWAIVPIANFTVYLLWVFRAEPAPDGGAEARQHPGRAFARGMYFYNSAFHDMASTGSVHAARKVISALLTILPVRGAIDFGCARGTWLREWQARSVADIVGVDGDYLDPAKLEIDPASFVGHDLSTSFRHERRFDLAQCLEVAEHLPESRAASLVADLVSHAPAVLFSAAPPGQGGEHHINEQPAEYWRRLFAAHDYVAIDCLRPFLIRDKRVPVWYRNNLVLYVRRDALHTVAPFAREFQLRDDETLTDNASLAYRIRKCIIRALPAALCNRFAQFKARRFQAA
jgi:putative flippase GtrA